METVHARPGFAAWSLVALILIAIWCLQLGALISLSPKLEMIYRDLGIKLPWATEAMMRAMRWVTAWAPVLLIAAVGLILGLWIAIRSTRLRRMLDHLCDCLPWSMTGTMERIRGECFLSVADRLEGGMSPAAALGEAVDAHAPAGLAARVHELLAPGTLHLGAVLEQTAVCDALEGRLIAHQVPVAMPMFLRFLADVHLRRRTSYRLTFLVVGCAALLLVNLLTMVIAITGMVLPFCHIVEALGKT